MFGVSQCPLCQALNKIKFRLRPPTAVLRILSLSGINFENTWKFLKSLRKRIRLTSQVYRDYFDIVTAADGAIFFILTLFSSHWTLLDCRHHLFKLWAPRILTNGKIVPPNKRSWNIGVHRDYKSAFKAW